MPWYVYEVILPNEEDEGQTFEIEQRISDPPLTHHPTTGQPVRRVFQAPNLPRKYTERQTKKMLSNENLAAKGFTKYEKASDGRYEKTAGKGPDSLSAD